MEIRTAILIVLISPVLPKASYFEELSDYVGHMLSVLTNSFERPVKTEPEYDHDVEIYDFVIVGAGSAGCVLANRLSEVHKWKILLLEAGIPENPVGKIPSVSQILQTTRYSWQFQTIPQQTGCLGMIDNICNQASGKGLGGSSSIGDNIYSVGNRYDYDEWEAGGNPGWSYNDVLTYFKKAEHVRLYYYDEEYHGEHGLVNVELQKNPSEVRRPFLRGVAELNYSILDYNGEKQIGFNDAHVTTLRGWRNSASSAYLESIHERSNLIVKTSSFVEKILIHNKKAFGVLYVRHGRHLVAKVKNEVILSAGAFGSPKILQLSGIGPQEYLKSVGIHPIVNLAVGDNLRDHVAFLGLQFVFSKWHHDIDYGFSFAQWFFHGEGPLTSCGIDALGYLNSGLSRDNPERPDFEIALSPIGLNQGYRLIRPITNFKKEIYDSFWQNTEGKDSFTILVGVSRAKSLGTVRIKSKNPHENPLIDPKYLENSEDVELLLYGIRRALEISNTTAFKKINATLNTRRVDGCENFEFSSDNYWRCAIRRLHISMSHPSGTNKMGPKNDSTAVVNSRLQVHSIEKLRVVDASVIPNANSAHIMAPVIMVAEKASDIIKEDWKKCHE